MTIFIILASMLALIAAGAIVWPLMSRSKERPPLIALISLAAMPVAAGLLYLEIGAPHALTVEGRLAAAQEAEAALAPPPKNPAAAIAAIAPEERQQMIEGMVAGLAERLAETPDDIDGWRMLARSYAVLGDASQSANAWREAATRSEETEDWRSLVGALLQRQGNEENVSTELESALKKLLAANENDPIALFFLGHADQQKGDAENALKKWEKLRGILPAGSPLTPRLNELISEAEIGAKAPIDQ